MWFLTKSMMLWYYYKLLDLILILKGFPKRKKQLQKVQFMESTHFFFWFPFFLWYLLKNMNIPTKAFVPFFIHGMKTPKLDENDWNFICFSQLGCSLVGGKRIKTPLGFMDTSAATFSCEIGVFSQCTRERLSHVSQVNASTNVIGCCILFLPTSSELSWKKYIRFSSSLGVKSSVGQLLIFSHND